MWVSRPFDPRAGSRATYVLPLRRRSCDVGDLRDLSRSLQGELLVLVLGFDIEIICSRYVKGNNNQRTHAKGSCLSPGIEPEIILFYLSTGRSDQRSAKQ